MTVRTPNPAFVPLLRIMSMPPSLARFAPVSAQKSLRTVLLRDSPLAAGQQATFDDTCQVTCVDGELARLNNVKLILQASVKTVSGLHLTLLSTMGMTQLAVFGNNSRFFLGADSIVRATVHLAGQSSLFIGDRTTMAQTRIIGSNVDISIGDDCQFHDETLMQCSDPHPIVDLDAGRVINDHRRAVQMGRHVLVGRRATLLADLRLGDGCVVNPGAVVEGDFAAGTQIGGVPAAVVRPRVAWARAYGDEPPDLSD